ncbi:hypothetical protein AVEN_194401-1 [Araneus ventricosus]|uniref:Uncharacterized protein n=1 Tax=Araneus ventricosus TaxID=182803 RepID=A0A4Y2A5U5_ARAVE|nr:hypothetical protein AVEN_194401-1 [Araneus ventricosus]
MRRARGLTHEEILKKQQRIDEIYSNDSEIRYLDGDEEYVPTECNNSDDESEISLQHDSECHENEQLPPSKARYPFIQYIQSKPDKFRIKFWLPFWADSKYVLNDFPYTGADSEWSAD